MMWLLSSAFVATSALRDYPSASVSPVPSLLQSVDKEHLTPRFCTKSRYCTIRGDPHFQTFDDAHYSTQDTGEYLLAQSLNADVQVNGCFGSFTNHDISYATKVAMRCGANTIILAEAKTQSIKLYEKQGANWVATNNFGANAADVWQHPTKPFHRIHCPDQGGQFGTVVEINFRTVSEVLTGNSIDILSAHIHMETRDIYNDVQGACNEFPPEQPGMFKGRNGHLVPFPLDRSGHPTFEANPNGVVTWKVNGLPDSIITAIGELCPTADGAGTVLVENGEYYDFSACDNDSHLINGAKKCIDKCSELHGNFKPEFDDCIYDVLAECDTNCKDVITQDY